MTRLEFEMEIFETFLALIKFLVLAKYKQNLIFNLLSQ